MAAIELLKTILINNINLKAYYRFEETGGTSVADSSGNSMTGTASRTNILNNVGLFGNGATFVSASSDKITITDNAILKPTGNLTFGLWMKTSTTGATQVLFQSQSQNTALAGIRMWRLNSDNFIRFDVAKNTGTSLGTDYQTAVSTSSVTNGAWHLCVGTWDGSNIRMYVDGKCEHTIAWTYAPVYAATNYVRLGCNNSTGTDSLFYDGQIDDAFLINGTALSADQIKELYEGRTIGELWPQSGLVGLWHLNGNSTDYSGNNNHGTDTSVTYSTANGKFGQGGSFNGSTSKITFTSNTQVSPTGNYTVLSWFKTTSGTRVGIYTAMYRTTASGERCGISLAVGNLFVSSSTNKLSHTHGASNATDGAGSKATVCGVRDVNDGKWHFGAVTFDGSTLRLYLDGSEEANTACAFNPGYVSTASPGIGFGFKQDSTYQDFFNGSLDEVVIYNRALSPQEIKNYYAWAIGRFSKII